MISTLKQSINYKISTGIAIQYNFVSVMGYLKDAAENIEDL